MSGEQETTNGADQSVVVNGIRIEQREISSVTIERGGVQITIAKPKDDPRPIGFHEETLRGV